MYPFQILHFKTSTYDSILFIRYVTKLQNGRYCIFLNEFILPQPVFKITCIILLQFGNVMFFIMFTRNLITFLKFC